MERRCSRMTEMQGHIFSQARPAAEKLGRVEAKDVALLHQTKPVQVVFEAGRKKKVYVPEIGPRLVVESREGSGAAELETDVAVSPHDGKARELVAPGPQHGRSRGVRFRGERDAREKRDQCESHDACARHAQRECPA